MATIIDNALTILMTILMITVGIPMVISITVIAVLAMTRIVHWFAGVLEEQPEEQPYREEFEEHDIVRYNGMLADLIWFNPCEREWMLQTKDGRFHFADTKELEMVEKWEKRS